MQKKIERGTLHVSVPKAKLHIEITSSPLFEDISAEGFESFNSLMEFFEWVHDNIEYLRDANEEGMDIVIELFEKDRNASAWIDNHDHLRMAIDIEDLESEELKECAEKLEKIREIVR